MLALAEGFHLGDLYHLGLLSLGLALLVTAGALSHQHERAFSAAVFYVAFGALGAVGLSLLDVSPFDPVDDHALLERRVPAARWNREEVTEADRDAAIDCLKRALVRDELSAEELAKRVESAHIAETLDELDTALADLMIG